MIPEIEERVSGHCRIVQHAMNDFHLGDAGTCGNGIGNARKFLLDSFGIQRRRRPSVAFAQDADEVGSATVNFIKADANDPFAFGFLFGDAPAQIDIGERHAASATERSDLRKDLLDQVFAFLLQVAKRAADEDAEFILLRHRRPPVSSVQ